MILMVCEGISDYIFKIFVQTKERTVITSRSVPTDRLDKKKVKGKTQCNKKKKKKRLNICIIKSKQTASNSSRKKQRSIIQNIVSVWWFRCLGTLCFRRRLTEHPVYAYTYGVHDARWTCPIVQNVSVGRAVYSGNELQIRPTTEWRQLPHALPVPRIVVLWAWTLVGVTRSRGTALFSRIFSPQTWYRDPIRTGSVPSFCRRF